MAWNWWVAQGLLVFTLIFIVLSMQQKTSVHLLWYRSIATLICTVAVCFLGEMSAIILCGAGIIRNTTALYFAYKPNTKYVTKWFSSGVIIALLIILNIVFWKSYLNILSIAFGVSMIIAFMQKSPKTIRKIGIIVGILGVTYYGLLLSPMNAIIELFGLISTIIGIIRFDVRKQKQQEQQERIVQQKTSV